MPEFGNTSRMKDFIVDHLSLRLSSGCAGAGRAAVQRRSWCFKVPERVPVHPRHCGTVGVAGLFSSLRFNSF